MQQPITDFEKHFEIYTQCIDITIDWNEKIKEYEAFKIETPQNIKDSIKRLNINSNFLIITSELATIGMSFNNSDSFLYKMFYIKSIYRIVYETFNFINDNGQFIFSEENEKTIEIKQKLKQFRRKYNIKEIGEIRNKIAAHYTEDFSVQISIMLKIDFESTMQMYFDFFQLKFEISNFVILDFYTATENNEFKEYFKFVEEELKKIAANQ
ncbi:hypothetical protein [Flavobacterium sp.]|uniref:hypothetical protein n=1 Tax=Flavobacterium sp. TaxID=239 RepID=UPI002635EE9A|nr:hypothetical protein [Flavobacterium sp.]